MSTPFQLQATLSLPGQPGLPNDPLVAAVLAAYDSKAEFELNLPSSSGTQVVNFGTMPSAGVKAYLIYYVPIAGGGAPAVMLTRNAGSAPEEISNGGFVCGANPTPSAGITAMSIAFTGAGKIQVWLLG